MAENENVPQEPTEEPQGTEQVDWEAKFKELQAQSRKWEERAKANKDKADKWDAYEQEGMSEVEKLTKRAESAESELAQLKAESQRNADAAEIAESTGVPASLLLHCADRADMEAFAKEYAGIQKVPAAPTAPTSRVVRGSSSKPSTADQFAEMAESFFRH
jgi:hypothetical protein